MRSCGGLESRRPVWRWQERFGPAQPAATAKSPRPNLRRPGDPHFCDSGYPYAHSRRFWPALISWLQSKKRNIGHLCETGSENGSI